MLQEVHCSENTIPLWSAEWGFKALFSCCFFLNFFDHLRDFRCDEIIIGGDFNLVLDLDMDKKGGLAKTHTESVKIIKDLCTQFDMVDACRVLNPDTRRYTWRRIRPQIQCRLHFFLVTQR